MKNYLIIFILALCFTCWLTDTGMAPIEEPLGIKDITAGACGVNKQEGMIPDFEFTDKTKETGYITKIDQKNPCEEAIFPWGAPR